MRTFRAAPHAVAAAILAGTAAAELALRLPLPGAWGLLAFRDRCKREMFVDDPELGYGLRASFRARLPGGAGEIGHQPLPGEPLLGMRGTGGEDGDVADIVVLGDSAAYSPLVRDEAAWVSRLARLGGWRARTLGVPGYAPSQALALYRRSGAAFGPRTVLLLLTHTDPEDELLFRGWREEGSGEGLRAYSLRRRLGLPRSWSRPALRLMASSRLADRIAARLMRAAALRRLSGEPAAPARGLELLSADIAALDAELRKRRAALGVVLTPDWGYFPRAKAQAARLKAALAGRGIPCLDLGQDPDWGRPGGEAVIAGDGHWNERGHAVAAALIRDFMMREGLAPTRRAGARSTSGRPSGLGLRR